MSDEVFAGRASDTAGAAEGGVLARFEGDIPPSPDWFRKAIAEPYETGAEKVNGARIAWQRWGRRGAPGLILVHGNGASAHWWDFIAPFFSKTHNVAALNFSGMGDSDWRETYSIRTFSEEIVAVMEATGLFEARVKPVMVAHSFGGTVSVDTATAFGDRFSGVVIADSVIPWPDMPSKFRPLPIRPNRIYEHMNEALSRFRLDPPQPCENVFLVDYIARWGIEKVEGGYRWRFDPRTRGVALPDDRLMGKLKTAKCRIALVRGEDSDLVTDEVVAYNRKELGEAVPYISIPQAYHHLMLDQPMAFVSTIRTLLEMWNPSET